MHPVHALIYLVNLDLSYKSSFYFIINYSPCFIVVSTLSGILLSIGSRGLKVPGEGWFALISISSLLLKGNVPLST